MKISREVVSESLTCTLYRNIRSALTGLHQRNVWTGPPFSIFTDKQIEGEVSMWRSTIDKLWFFVMVFVVSLYISSN